MQICLAQLNYQINDFQSNQNAIIDVIQQYKKADLIVFSEMALSGYYPQDAIWTETFFQEQENALQVIKNATKIEKTAVLIGIVVKQNQYYYSQAVLIDQGKCISQVTKKHLNDAPISQEKRHLSSGIGAESIQWRNHRLLIGLGQDVLLAQDNQHKPIDCAIMLVAKPSIVNQHDQYTALLQTKSQQLGCPIVQVNQVGGYDGLVYQGASSVTKAPYDPIEAKRFQPHCFMVDMAHFPSANGSDPSSPKMRFILDQLCCGLTDYLKKNNFKKVVVGCSGGIDSALTLAIATIALGSENVIAIAMPSCYSSSESLIDAQQLCDNLGIDLYTHSIDSLYQSACDEFEKSFNRKLSQITRENIQARIRGRIVMAFSNNDGALPLTTGNKSEAAVGYATLYGDMCGALNCIGDLYKQQVYELSYFINAHYDSIIPQNILDKAPSAELSADQKDSDTLPDYPELDALLQWYLDDQVLQQSEKDSLKKTVHNIDPAIHQQVKQLIAQSEFKRQQAPLTLIVSARPFGVGRQVPLTGKMMF